MRSADFDKIKRYYDAGFWNKTMILNAVKKGKITEDEAVEILGTVDGE